MKILPPISFLNLKKLQKNIERERERERGDEEAYHYNMREKTNTIGGNGG